MTFGDLSLEPATATHPAAVVVPPRTNYHEAFGLPSFEDHTFLIFGYGSILWKQEFPYEAEYETYIKGYDRLFYQGTCAHRGVPGKPGRVVTLLPSETQKEESRVYGKAYQLPNDPEKLNAIFTALDVRESGYDRVELTLYNAHPTTPTATTKKTKVDADTAFSESVEAAALEQELDIFDHPAAPAVQHADKKVVCLCYIATERNEGYLGAASMDDMAAQILNSAGASGTNREYLFFLADALRAMGAEDDHVFTLDAVAKKMLQSGAAEVRNA